MVNPRRYDMDVMRAVAERLREIREGKKLSQRDVYIDTEINIGWIETGQRNPTISTLSRLCSYYGVSLKEFFDAEAFAAPVEYDDR